MVSQPSTHTKGHCRNLHSVQAGWVTSWNGDHVVPALALAPQSTRMVDFPATQVGQDCGQCCQAFWSFQEFSSAPAILERQATNSMAQLQITSVSSSQSIFQTPCWMGNLRRMWKPGRFRYLTWYKWTCSLVTAKINRMLFCTIFSFNCPKVGYSWEKQKGQSVLTEIYQL